MAEIRSFNLRFPQKTRVNTLLVTFVVIAIICFVGGIGIISYNRNLGFYLLSVLIADLIVVPILPIAFKNYFSESKTTELYNDRIVIKGDLNESIFFNDIIDYKSNYKSTYGRNTTTIIIKLIDGKKFSVRSTPAEENSIFVKNLNEEIEQLIASGNLQLTKKLYAPFLESKWMLATLFCYSASTYVFSQYFKNVAGFKLMIIVIWFIAIAGWLAYVSVKATNNTKDWYQRE